MADLKAMATATAPREFELSYSTTIEEVFEKLNARAAAFQMGFELKDGIGGKKISFKKEPELDVAISLTVKDGNKIKITPVIKESQTTVNGMRVDKNSMLRKGVSGVASLPLQRGEYVDAVTDTVKKKTAQQRACCGLCCSARYGSSGKGLAHNASALHLPRPYRCAPLLCRQNRHGYPLYPDNRLLRNRLSC